MGDKLVSEIGKRLSQHARPNKDVLVKSLKQAGAALSKLEQKPLLESAIKPLSDYILTDAMLQHKDRDVKLLLGICFSEIMRILAPDPPFSESHLRGIFKIIISVFSELADTTSPYFSKSVKILETVAKLKCCVIMLDIECEDLVLAMINTFFSVVREHHQQSLVDAILSIMTLILEEKVLQPFVDVILHNLLDEKKDTTPTASSRLSASVIQACSENLEPFVRPFLTSCILDPDAIQSELKKSYHDIIYKIYPCAPQMLLGVIPSLTQELLADQVDIRKKSVNLIGKLFALPEHHIAQEYHRLFVEFLKRFSDKSAEVRVSALQRAKDCYTANPSQTESKELLSALYGRLLDFDDSVRTQAVIVACDISRSNLKYVPSELIEEVSKRLRDKKISVRKKAMKKLLEVYQDYCTKCSEGCMALTDHFEKIPCSIFMLCYDKDCKEFRLQNLERVLVDELFPADLSVEERTRHWIHLFTLFNSFHMKALTLILCQKRRVQTEFQSYLALRGKEKESSSEELQKRTKASFMKLWATFADPTKAEECFYKLDHMKDNNIFNLFTEMLKEVTIVEGHAIRAKLLEMVRDKHPHLDFLQLLLDKSMFNIFSSEHVSCILDFLSDNENGTKSSGALDLLSTIISSFPILLEGSKEKFQMLISEEHRPFNEKLIQVLAKAGTHVSIKSCDIYPNLKRVCIEGTRTQSKSAVSAIAALASAPELFSDLCKTLVDSLRRGENVPTILKSLDCVGQHSFSTIKLSEREIAVYIMDRIFSVKPSNEPAASFETSNPCDTCKLKIYGLKALVKMLLQNEESKSRYQLDELLELFPIMLRAAGTEDYTFSCPRERDGQYIRLAAAKAVLKISMRWDLHISPQIFRLTVLIGKDPSLSVSRPFMDKTHKLLKSHVIPKRYACAFALAAPDYPSELKTIPYIYMEEFIREYSKEVRVCQSSAVEGEPITDHPTYVVVYLIHILAHDPGFPAENCMDEKLYATFCSPLFFIILASVSAVDCDKDLTLSYLLSIFRAIRMAEDAVDRRGKSKLQILADIGISVVNALHHRGISSHAHNLILLPASLYKESIAKKYKEASPGSPSPSIFDEIFVKKIVHHYKSNISLFISSGPNNGKITQEAKTRSDNLKCSIMNLASDMRVDLSSGRAKEEHSSYLRGKVATSSLRKETITRGGRKRDAPAYPELVELHNNYCAVNGLAGDPEKLSSCDSVTIKDLNGKSGVSTQGIDVSNSDTIKGSVMARNVVNSVNSEVLVGQRIILSSPINKCGYSGTDDGVVSENNFHELQFPCDSREEVQLLSLTNETCANIGESALQEKECVAAEKPNALHPLQRMSSRIKACCSDPAEYSTLSSLKATIDSTNKESENISKRLVPLKANKNKKRDISVDTSTSEIADQNENPVSRRTRSRKV